MTALVGAPVPLFFAAPGELGAWLAAHHATARELWVGYFKVGTSRPSLTWPESVDEALCWGWIDGVRKTLGAESYVIRFTPRKVGSTWSAVNIRRMEELIAAGRVAPAGMAAFAARTADKSAIYAYEQRHAATLDADAEAQSRALPGAWEFFCAQPAWYRRTATYRVVSAKKPETRQRRLAELISRSAAGLPIKELDRRPKVPD